MIKSFPSTHALVVYLMTMLLNCASWISRSIRKEMDKRKTPKGFLILPVSFKLARVQVPEKPRSYPAT
jgi:membrane-associated phospholipid phosphatase